MSLPLLSHDLMRMHGVAEAIHVKMAIGEAIVSLDSIAVRNGMFTAFCFSDPKVKPGHHVSNYCRDFEKRLGNGAVLFHRDNHTYRGRWAWLSRPVRQAFDRVKRKNWSPGQQQIEWNSFFAVIDERPAALALLRACLEGELVLRDVLHFHQSYFERFQASYDDFSPGYEASGNDHAGKSVLRYTQSLDALLGEVL